jgi:TetR/AcrR family transcriptional regulator, transcriptional repressor for nem operon
MPSAPPPTERGRRARERIVRAAADLFRRRGVRSTSVDDVLVRARSGKGQLYHYFSSKDELVGAVVDHQLDQLLGRQAPLLQELGSWDRLERWLNELPSEFVGPRGTIAACPLGALAAELAGSDERLRQSLAAAFSRWAGHIEAGLTEMQRRGELRADADPGRLGLTTIAALEGGLLLARTYKDAGLLHDALDAAYAYLRSFAADPAPISAART